jgi:hypothetical protein
MSAFLKVRQKEILKENIMVDVLVQIGGTEINLSGLIVGAASFLIIIFGRWACIAGEYHFTKNLWYLFLVLGISSLIAALFIKMTIPASILSIFGLTLLWGIQEIIEQEERVEKGWFPKNPKRKKE